MTSKSGHLTRKIYHAKTGHAFLLYFSLADDGTSYTLDLTIAGPGNENVAKFDTKLLRRWWTDTWSVGDDDPASLENVTSSIVQGGLHIRGWSETKSRQSAGVPLKIILDDPASADADSKTVTKTALVLTECSKEEATLRRKLLLLNITEKAQDTQDCCIFRAVSVREELLDLQGEVSSLTRNLKKRDRIIDDLKSQLETANEQLKEYIRDAAPTKPTNPRPKIPANHSKAAVTKKRRLVQKQEYED